MAMNIWVKEAIQEDAFCGTINQVVERLLALRDSANPGLEIPKISFGGEWSDAEYYINFMRPETEAETAARIKKEQAKLLREKKKLDKKQEQYEKLKKELGHE
jgi:hypothetical protein